MLCSAQFTITDVKDGEQGVGISSVAQTTTSSADGGSNVITVTKTDGTTSTFTVLNGRKGGTGGKGDDGKSFVLVASTETYRRDLRDSGSQSITVATQISGYSGTPSVSVSAGTYSSGRITIPYDNTYDSVTITATLSGAPTQTLVLSVIDVTEYGMYYGVGTGDPTGTILEGDHYFNGNTAKIRYRQASSWVDLEDAGITDQKEYATILSNAMGDALGSIGEGSVISSYYAYFQTIIANQIRAATITVDAANITGKIDISEVDGGGLSLSKDGIGATSSDGTSSWRINADGTATFKNASITGNLEAKKVSHEALKTIDAMTGKTIGSSSMPSVVSKTLWNLEAVTAGLRSAFLQKGHSYSGATINGVAVKRASFNQNGASNTYNSTATNTTITIGSTYTGSVTISAGSSRDVVEKLVNNYSFPVWVTATMSLGGNFNSIYARIYNTSGSYTQYPSDSNVKAILLPGEKICIHASSSAWWGSKTASGSIRCDISTGYAETTTAQRNFEGTNYGGGEATAESQPRFVQLGTISFSSPSRYLAITYNGTCENLYRKNGSSYVALTQKSGGNYMKLYDLGSEMSSVELYYQSTVIETTVTTGPEDDETTETTYDYSVFNASRFVWTAFRTLGTEPLVIVDTNGKEYRYSSVGYSGLYRSDTISSLFGYTVSPTMYSGKVAYDKFLSTLGVKIGTYSLNTSSKITIDGNTLSSLTYMTVGSDRITFENSSGNITFYTTGDTESDLKSAYSAISAYIVLMASTLGVETADIRPKANNTYSIGADGNVYARGYFNTLNVTTANITTVNGTTIYGAVFN